MISMKKVLAVVAVAALPASAAAEVNQPQGGLDAQGLSRQENQASGGLGGQGAGQQDWNPRQGQLPPSAFPDAEQQASDPQRTKQQTGRSGQATELGQGKDCPPESTDPRCAAARGEVKTPIDADQLRRESVPPATSPR